MIRTLCLAFGMLLAGPQISAAQAPSPPAPQTALTAGELDQLVAPVALYPDALLAEILMASTYPLEVVEGARFVRENALLKDEQLKAAADKQGWDNSIKSLAATPDVLKMMSEKLDWTQKLGDAVLAQQPDVMDSVQRLRTKAQAANKLTTTRQQKVSMQKSGNRDVIIIEPAVPNTVYVPYYDPAVVYGVWDYPAYPPYYFWPPGYATSTAIVTGIAFSAGFAIGAWAANNTHWGGGLNWGNGSINVNRPIDINNIHVNTWTHNPDHRHGVRYNNLAVQQKFGHRDGRAGAAERMDFRGRDGKQVLQPDRDRAGDRAGQKGALDRKAASRPTSAKGEKAATRPNAKTGNRRPDANRAASAARQRDNAFDNIHQGSLTRAHADRGRASVAGRGSFAQMGARPSAPRAAVGGGGRQFGGRRR